MKEIIIYFENRAKIANAINNCFLNISETTMKKQQDESMFVVTSDIPAMCLRYSSAQLNNIYNVCGKRPNCFLIEGIINKQVQSILIDQYGNAFNEYGNGREHQDYLLKKQVMAVYNLGDRTKRLKSYHFTVLKEKIIPFRYIKMGKDQKLLLLI